MRKTHREAAARQVIILRMPRVWTYHGPKIVEFSACHDPNHSLPLRIHVGMSPVEQAFKRCPFAIILETEGTSTSQTSALSAQLPPRTHDCGNRIT
jgi:hypothetical protein